MLNQNSVARKFDIVRRNIYVAITWSIFTASLGYIIMRYIADPQDLSELESKAVDIKLDEHELKEMMSLYQSWERFPFENVMIPKFLINKSVSEISHQDTHEFLVFLNNGRTKLDSILLLSNTLHFENKFLDEALTTIKTDAEYLDEYLKTRANFIHAVIYDHAKALEMMPEMEMSIERFRKFREMEVHFKTILAKMRQAMEAHDVLVRTYNRKSQVFSTENTLLNCAWTYNGLFVGGWSGFIVRRVRKNKRRRRPVSSE